MFKRLFDKLSLKGYRGEVTANQRKQIAETQRLYEQLFLNNPVLIVKDVKMYLPLFYVDHIQKLIFRDRDFYEKETLQYLKQQYGSFKTVLDIGSNIGNHMLYYCSQLDARNVTCFEPNTFNHAVLCKNVELNNLQDVVTVHNVALGETSGTGVQKDFTNMNTGMNRIEMSADTDSAGATVMIKSLDDFGYSNIDFVKIDVEGFEIEVLKGAARTLKNSKAVVMLEVFNNNQQAVDELMESYGYKKSYTIEEYNCIYVAN
jgi:FkbM family methyltransferase